jgi:hypothetical protein
MCTGQSVLSAIATSFCSHICGNRLTLALAALRRCSYSKASQLHHHVLYAADCLQH